MGETPKLPEVNDFVPEDDIDKAYKSHLGEEAVYQTAHSMDYELDISNKPETIPKVDERPEKEFERRHEVKDEPEDESDTYEPSDSRMMPLGDILTTYPITYKQALEKTDSPKIKSSKILSILDKPMYRRAVFGGVLSGLAITSIILVVLMTISR